MKIVKLFIALILLTSTLILNGQESPHSFSLSVVRGYGSFGMNDLKRINTESTRGMPFKVKEVNNFDPAPFFSAALKYTHNKNLYTALGYQNYATGSRFGLKDYSGFYVLDQYVTGHYINIEPGLVFGNRYISFSPSLPMGLMFSSLLIEEELIVGDFERQFDLSVVAQSLVFMPSIKVTVPLAPFLGLTCGAGWMVDNGGKYHYKKHKDAVLNIGGQVHSGWQGWRLSAGIVLTRPVKNQTVKEFRDSEYFDR
jgi:hypothetical protein